MKTKFNPANWLESNEYAQWILSQHGALEPDEFFAWLFSASGLTIEKTRQVIDHLDLLDKIGHFSKVLHLPIKGVWFNMIAAGEKKEEYRDVKRYYIDRLRKKVPLTKNGGIDLVAHNAHDIWATEKFDVLHLTAGYGHDKPQLWADIESITIGRGNPDWGAEPGKDYFVIRIGKILHTKNFVPQSQPSSGTNV